MTWAFSRSTAAVAARMRSSSRAMRGAKVPRTFSTTASRLSRAAVCSRMRKSRSASPGFETTPEEGLFISSSRRVR